MLIRLVKALGPIRVKGLLVFVATSVALLLSMVTTSSSGMPPCLFHTVTGIPCASCGMTRAFLELGHGHFGAAVQHNLASPLVYAAAWVLLGAAFLQVRQGQEHITALWRNVKGVALPTIISILAIGWACRLWQTFHR